MLFAVDPTAAVVDEAIATGADLVVTHHPLLLTPVHGVPADDPKGRLVHRLVRASIGLFAAHTNADRAADHGVNDALAAALGLAGTLPLDPVGAPRSDTLVAFVPVPGADRLADALSAAGAGGDRRLHPLRLADHRHRLLHPPAATRSRRSVPRAGSSGSPRRAWRWWSRGTGGPPSSVPCRSGTPTRTPATPSSRTRRRPRG
ncbi:hypothetical protein A7K94_0215140, partial [Modestobacter sp. VKM Ac-2676]